MNNTVGITFVCGEKGEMLTSKTRPQGLFLSASYDFFVRVFSSSAGNIHIEVE